jgi:xanthine dehydrogenase accessory factor
MLVWPDGRIVGTVGGATLEERVIEDARESLASGRGRLGKYIFSSEGDPESIGLCGGEVEVHVEVLEPDPEMLIIGAGHVAQPVAAIGHLIGMHVTVVDDRPAFATRERFPQADVVAVVPYDAATEKLDPLPATIGQATYIVVATWGWDEPALAQVLAADPPPAYVGLVASPTKARAIFEQLAQRGLPQARLDLVRAPIGLDLGAETPEEIALAIVAEILAVRRKASGRPLFEARKPRQESEGA